MTAGITALESSARGPRASTLATRTRACGSFSAPSSAVCPARTSSPPIPERTTLATTRPRASDASTRTSASASPIAAISEGIEVSFSGTPSCSSSLTASTRSDALPTSSAWAAILAGSVSPITTFQMKNSKPQHETSAINNRAGAGMRRRGRGFAGLIPGSDGRSSCMPIPTSSPRRSLTAGQGHPPSASPAKLHTSTQEAPAIGPAG